MQDFFFKGVWRMDWGLGNPNKTAALIAALMIAAWGLVYIRKWGFWAALALFTGLGICLIHTFSRGGVIALFAGLVPLVWFAPRPWPWSKLIGVVVSVWVIIGFSVYLSAHERYGKGTEDRSITNRLEIWKVAPQMMVDAPGGWGLGKAGVAYVQWYQPLDRNESYRTLVNSHLTWLVEFGWPLRILYLLAWSLVFALCWPTGKQPWMVIPLGIWLAFFVAALFSSVAESLWLWTVPALALIGVLIGRIKAREWPTRWAWGDAVAGTTVLTLALYLAGSRESAVHLQSGMIVIGGSEPNLVLVIDPKVTGQSYGRKVRSQLKGAKFGLAITESFDGLEGFHDKTLVVAGSVLDRQKLGPIITNSSKVVLMNPAYFPQEVNVAPEKLKNVEVIFGEFSQSPAISAWQQAASVKRLEGVGDFLPNWTQLISQL